MSKLAIDGGSPVRSKPWPKWPIIGDLERKYVDEVLDSGLLQGFAASKGDKFLGGPMVRRLEDAVAEFYGVDYAVSFTSATAALHASMDALGVGPGANIIATPYSFHPSATCALMNNAVPVFADIDPNIFTLDPGEVAKAITPYTKAIVVVHLFGGAADMDGIMAVAREHDIYVVEDCAQAPGATYKGNPVGTIGDVGVFSFVAQKNASSGEGGMLITNNQGIAETARLFRNHAEALDEPRFGYNFRMTEVTAALALAQFEQLEKHNEQRMQLAFYLSDMLDGLRASIQTPRHQSQHVYYVYPLLVEGVDRDWFCKAMVAEGILWHPQYIRPLYTYPVFQQRGALAYTAYPGELDYAPGLCPVCEHLSYETMTLTMVVRPPATSWDMRDIRDAVEKVLEHAP
jgi:dTDP-4-amino-4,6-dideoxygalactose transaminase